MLVTLIGTFTAFPSGRRSCAVPLRFCSVPASFACSGDTFHTDVAVRWTKPRRPQFKV